MAMKNPTRSVYELDPFQTVNAVRNMETMKVIMVKGIGYVVVSKDMEDPELLRKMGDVVAKTYED